LGRREYFILRITLLHDLTLRHFLKIKQAEATIEDGKRILFRFDRAAFTFKFLPFKVPYPVPFRLLGDEAKGWLDTTYLSHAGNIRISRGNKVQLHNLDVVTFTTSECS
jgi:hypothetical protein